jgi:hypothetical protein
VPSPRTTRGRKGVDEREIYTQVRSSDFVTAAKIAWRDAYVMQMRAAVHPLAQAADRGARLQ